MTNNQRLRLDDPSCAGDDDLDITDVYELEEDNNA